MCYSSLDCLAKVMMSIKHLAFFTAMIANTMGVIKPTCLGTIGILWEAETYID